MKIGRVGWSLVAGLLGPLALQSAAVNAYAAPPSLPSSPPLDEVVTGAGDLHGYHLYVGRARDGWAWKPVVTLLPEPGLEQPWLGSECLTGDGAYAIVVVAPRQQVEHGTGADAAGIAYSVDLQSAQVRKLADHVAYRYFSPGCGTEQQVALTRYTVPDQRRTQLLMADAASGRVVATVGMSGQVTSAVPVGLDFVAVRGQDIVRVAPNGKLSTLARTQGVPYRLHSNDLGGVDYLLPKGKDRATAWHVEGVGAATQIGEGPIGRLHLYPGRHGRNTLVGADEPLPAGANLRAATQVDLPVEGTSLDGDVLVMATPGIQPSAPVERPASQLPLSQLRRVVNLKPVGTTIGNRPSRTAGNSTDVAPSSRRLQPATNGNIGQPACAVPRNDLYRQTPQPTAAQIDWAIQMATRGQLVGANSRPAGIWNLGLPPYSPNADFPSPALAGGGSIPPQVLEGMMAQESNWSQASFHAPPGTAGNPLIANYYGTDASNSRIDYSQADCGYGIGQVTDFMTAASTAQPEAVKIKVAIDYAENIAASQSILAGKWNQLAQFGIVMGNGDPSVIENWYFAIWAYNSGIHLPGSGSSWGLGWANNPINPVYPADRQPFLQATYADAAHPEKWPYQEKVFGWMRTSLVDAHGNPEYTPVAGTLFDPAHDAFCSPTLNNCNPGNAGSPCQSSDLTTCWWHTASSPNCGGCHTGFYTVAAGSSEPGAANPHPPACQLPAGLPAGSVVVTTEPTEVNLVGCNPAQRNWSDGGNFQVGFGTNGTGQPTGVIDWHQLGGGFGGHFYFSHTEPLNNAVSSVAGTWTPNLPAGAYEIRTLVPDFGGTTHVADYAIIRGDGGAPFHRILDQAPFNNDWVSLGYATLRPGAKVILTNNTVDGAGSDDVSFGPMLFVPVGGYVALGDSYSSGEGNPPFLPGSDTATDSCHRSSGAYPERFGSGSPRFKNLPIIFAACSGAVIDDLRSQSAQPGHAEPPQIEQIPANARIVTLTMGGNDIGFADVATNCILAYHPGGESCRQHYTDAQGHDTLSAKIQALRSRLVAAYAAVKSRSSGTVWVLTYPVILMASSDPRFDPLNKCAGLRAEDQDWLRAKTSELDSVIRDAAVADGVNVIDEENAFAGHEVCSQNPYAIDLQLSPDRRSYSFHPNGGGHGQLALDVSRAVGG